MLTDQYITNHFENDIRIELGVFHQTNAKTGEGFGTLGVYRLSTCGLTCGI